MGCDGNHWNIVVVEIIGGGEGRWLRLGIRRTDRVSSTARPSRAQELLGIIHSIVAQFPSFSNWITLTSTGWEGAESWDTELSNNGTSISQNNNGNSLVTNDVPIVIVSLISELLIPRERAVQRSSADPITNGTVNSTVQYQFRKPTV